MRYYSSTEYDKVFDELVSSGVNLPWLPAVGKAYSSQPTDKRLIIIGESFYAWKNNSEEHVLELLNNKYYVRENIDDHVNKRIGFFPNIERAIAGKDTLDSIQKEAFWNRICFHNLVVRPMRNPKERPTYKDYVNGWRSHLPVYKILKPSACIMLGTEASKINAFVEVVDNSSHSKVKYDKIGRYLAKSLKVNTDCLNIIFVFIKHPSAFFNWRNWHSYLMKEIPDLCSS